MVPHGRIWGGLRWDTQDSLFPDNELKDSQLVAALGGKGPSYANQKKSNMLVRSIKPSDRARKCIALFSTESAKRQKSKATLKLPSSWHSSATPSNQKRRNPISLPISTINNSTPNPQYGGFLHPTPSSSGEHLQEPITVMGSWHLKVPLPSCGSSISPQQELA